VDHMTVSNDLLDDRIALHGRFETDGYLFFRDVIDRDDVARARDRVAAWCVECGLLSGDGSMRWTGQRPSSVAAQPDELHATGVWQWLARRPSTEKVLRAFFGEPAYLLPLTEYHFAWPGKNARAGVHQDGAYSIGLDFAIFWIPLMDIDEAVGGVAVAAGQHRRGWLHPDFVIDPSNADPVSVRTESPFVPDESVPADSWQRANYRPGDVLVMDRMLPHQGQPNRSNVLRLSIDFRAAAASAPRPVIGTVTTSEATSITVTDDDGHDAVIAVDARTVLRAKSYSEPPVSTADFIGRRVIVATAGDRARLVRFPYGAASRS
jgi:ectoine hydroxylase-related dioxygenase (phytanoyl-CoA dioxygenase family)